MIRKKEVFELFCVFAFIIACHVSKNTGANRFPDFDKEGHRGCRGLMPENTIPAMLKALDLGVTTLEMDAHITRDKLVIISHDAFFNHEITTKPDGSYLDEKDEKNHIIYKMDYSETLQYDVGLKSHPHFRQQQKLAVHKPLLSDLIDSVEKYSRKIGRKLPFYNIETKSLPVTDNIYHPEPAEFIDLLINVIRKKGIESRVIIQSFDIRTLQILHRNYPQIRTSLLIENYDKRGAEAQLAELGFIPTIYSPDFSLVNEKLLQFCHRRHIKVIPWTVDNTTDIESLRRLGVDGIITDYPNLLHDYNE